MTFYIIESTTLLPIACQSCEGDGGWWIADAMGHPVKVPCPTCDGIGQLADDAADEALEVLAGR